jgi:hypothetical protein
VDHARRRDRELRNLVRGDAGRQEPERVAEDGLRDAELAVDAHRRRREFDVTPLVVEPHLEVLCGLRHAVQLVHEVHVPRAAAQLAVRHAAQTDGVLQRDRFADRLVLDRAQLRLVDRPGRACFTGPAQRRWAEQAADVVGAERRPVARCHRGRQTLRLPRPHAMTSVR